MKQGDAIFVYGTLRVGQSADLNQGRRALHLGEDRINGLIYHLNWFPGAKAETVTCFDPEQPSISGDVFLLRDNNIVTILDSYEGYPSLYNRIQTVTEKGRTVWVYTYNGNLDDKEPIRTGDWVVSKAAGEFMA